MKIIAPVVAILAVIALLCPAKSHAESSIAYATGTITSIIVTSNPALMLSTGTKMNYVFEVTHDTNSSLTQAYGQLMYPRFYEEIFNDSGQTIYIGFDSRVSSQTGANCGRKLPHGASLSYSDGLPKWAVSETSTTLQRIIITQER